MCHIVVRMVIAMAWNDVHQADNLRVEELQDHLPQFIDHHIDVAARNSKLSIP